MNEERESIFQNETDFPNPLSEDSTYKCYFFFLS